MHVVGELFGLGGVALGDGQEGLVVGQLEALTGGAEAGFGLGFGGGGGFAGDVDGLPFFAQGGGEGDDFGREIGGQGGDGGVQGFEMAGELVVGTVVEGAESVGQAAAQLGGGLAKAEDDAAGDAPDLIGQATAAKLGFSDLGAPASPGLGEVVGEGLSEVVEGRPLRSARGGREWEW